MARQLRVEIVGDASSLQRALGQATSGASRFGGTLGRLGKLAVLSAGAAGVGALAIGLRQGIKEYTESAKVAAQTNAVIKSTGGVANVTAKQVDGLAESLMRKTGVDDEAIKSGENMMLTFLKVRNEVGKGNDIFNQATKAVLDMDTVMTQGNVTSESLAKTSIRVGKALNDPIQGLTALKKVGVSFTEAQKEQIKAMVESGDVMGAQKMILAELTKEFGGSAEAVGNTFPKQLAVLKESFNNFAGDLVAKAIPSVQRFVDFLNTRLIPAEGFVAKLKVVWEGVSEVAVDLWGQLRTAVMGETVMVRLPMEKAVEFVEVEGLASKLKEAVKVRIAAIDWSDVLVTVGVAIGKGVLQLQEAIWRFLFMAWKTAWSLLLTAAAAAATELAGAVVRGISNLPGAFSAAVGVAMRAGVTAITNTMGSAFTAALNLGNRIVAGAASGVADIGSTILKKLEAVIRAISTTATNAYAMAVGIGSAIVSGALAGLVGLASRVGSAIASQARAGIDWARRHLGSTAEQYAAANLGVPMADGIIGGVTSRLTTSLPFNLSKVLRDALNTTGIGASATTGGTGIGVSLKEGIDTFLENKLPDNLAQVLGLAFDEATANFSQAALGVTWTSTPTSAPPTPVALGPSRLADPDAGLTFINYAPINSQQQLDDMVQSAAARLRNSGRLPV